MFGEDKGHVVLAVSRWFERASSGGFGSGLRRSRLNCSPGCRRRRGARERPVLSQGRKESADPAARPLPECSSGRARAGVLENAVGQAGGVCHGQVLARRGAPGTRGLAVKIGGARRSDGSCGKKISFRAQLEAGGEGGAWTALKVPFDVEKEFGTKARVAVKARLWTGLQARKRKKPAQLTSRKRCRCWRPASA
jgi:Domain of unknown function (DUF1905)